MTDIHALIRNFLQDQTIISLSNRGEQDATLKAGVVPFVYDEDGFRFYVMKPRGHIPELGLPTYQVCKGTRMHFQEQFGWRDMKKPDVAGTKETLAETALREGIEEIGLKLDNITQLYDVGGFGFSSATTGKEKQMWLFAASVESEDDFLRDAEVAVSTAERRWVSTEEFSTLGRDDHQSILKEIEKTLQACL